MRIIRAAKRQDEIRDTCHNCGSILGIALEDIKYENGYYGFKCPVCEKRTEYTCSNRNDLFGWYMEDQNDIEV